MALHRVRVVVETDSFAEGVEVFVEADTENLAAVVGAFESVSHLAEVLDVAPTEVLLYSLGRLMATLQGLGPLRDIEDFPRGEFCQCHHREDHHGPSGCEVEHCECGEYIRG